jgi:hypothetical protein
MTEIRKEMESRQETRFQVIGCVFDMDGRQREYI